MTALPGVFFFTFLRNILGSFRGLNLLWHLLAIGATFVLVSSGVDWMYFRVTRPYAGYLFSAVIVGSRMPFVFPLLTYLVGSVGKNRRSVFTAYAAAQAALIGLIISSAYKAFTGRPSPRHAANMLVDTSRVFRFGFLRGGVFWGWPSSHTTVAFAMAISVWTMYPRSKVTKFIALIYAFYIGVGVSMTIHWFSDFVAGAIIGTVIGKTVGKAFKSALDAEKS
jgi:membrane-associated phospholipid phosphatase